MRVPFVDLARDVAPLRKDLERSITDLAFGRTNYILGPDVDRFGLVQLITYESVV